MRITHENLERLKTAKGGYSRETLRLLGVPWPPPKGWKKRLLKGHPKKRKKRKAKTLKKPSGRVNFYKGAAWKKKRYEILKRYGARCMCCGISAKDGAVINVDHIKPLKTHWELRLVEENLQVLCASCNRGKGGWDDTDWRSEYAEPSLSVILGERMQ